MGRGGNRRESRQTARWESDDRFMAEGKKAKRPTISPFDPRENSRFRLPVLAASRLAPRDAAELTFGPWAERA